MNTGSLGLILRLKMQEIARYRKKEVDERSQRILFRCDGDTQLGLGHVVRCLALADELRDGHGCGVSFAMVRGPAGFDLVRQAGYLIEQKQGDYADFWLETVIQRLQPDVLVLDVRSELARGRVEKWRSNGLLIVTLDDPSERRLAADLAFYPPVPQVQHLDWTGFTGEGRPVSGAHEQVVLELRCGRDTVRGTLGQSPRRS